jgi:hypothetical protein
MMSESVTSNQVGGEKERQNASGCFGRNVVFSTLVTTTVAMVFCSPLNLTGSMVSSLSAAADACGAPTRPPDDGGGGI